MSVIREIKREMTHQLESIDVISINWLARMMLETMKSDNNIYFTGIGKSENMAFHCSDVLKSVGIRAFQLDAVKAFHGDVGTIRRNDMVLFFSNSGNTAELLDLIELVTDRGAHTVGVCCTKENKFKKKCKIMIELPLLNEIEMGDISSVPTNSAMAQLLFTNILVVKIVEFNKVTIGAYRKNHLSGAIGKYLKTIKDSMITIFPKININDASEIKLTDILLKMSHYNFGCCIFMDSIGKNIEGILLDGDIRRLLLSNPNIHVITMKDINKNFKYETDLDKLVGDIEKHLKYVPVLAEENKLLGIVKVY
jgi:arabinose-5-phosphate isomerase